jgi:hypothetical protein
MPRRNTYNIPKPSAVIIGKKEVLNTLSFIDGNRAATRRVLSLENELRLWIESHIASLPGNTSELRKFNTNPYVLMFYAKQRNYSTIAQLEKDILPAKLFSSMETSAGRMVQEKILPIWGWENVSSAMHSEGSVLDCKKRTSNILNVLTLKSGPRCLNDEMSKDIADDVVAHCEQWADAEGVDHVHFTYSVVYGTPKQSNKKDWHVLRNIVETVGTRYIIEEPDNKWNCSFRLRNKRVDVDVKIGASFWEYIGSSSTLVEVIIALIRACLGTERIDTRERQPSYSISDLEEIISTNCIPQEFNISILQRSQIEWVFFLLSHYCDSIVED